MASYRISQLADRVGVPATTLRFYETAGLLSAERTPSGYRMYGEEAVERLAFISSGKTPARPRQAPIPRDTSHPTDLALATQGPETQRPSPNVT